MKTKETSRGSSRGSARSAFVLCALLFALRDGRFVIASPRDPVGNVLVERLRMVFAKGTPPERAVRRLRAGNELNVFGMPRLDFAEVSRRVGAIGRTRTS